MPVSPLTTVTIDNAMTKSDHVPKTPIISSPALPSAASKPRRVLLPNIPRRKTSHPSSRSLLAGSATPMTLSQSIARAVQTRVAANAKPNQGSSSPVEVAISSLPTTNTDSKVSTPQTANFVAGAKASTEHTASSTDSGPCVHQRRGSVASLTLSADSWADYAGLVVDAEQLDLSDAQHDIKIVELPGAQQVAYSWKAPSDLAAEASIHVLDVDSTSFPISIDVPQDPHDLVTGLGIQSHIVSAASAIPKRSHSTPSVTGAVPQQTRFSDPSSSQRSRQTSFAGSTSRLGSRSATLSQSSKSSSVGSMEEIGAFNRSSASTAASQTAFWPRSPSSEWRLGTPPSTVLTATPKIGNGVATSSSSSIIGSAGSVRRKGKPSSLAIGPATPSLAYSKGLASPIARARTPPPTNPPTEPLPPLPASASLAARSVRSPTDCGSMPSPQLNKWDSTHYSASFLQGTSSLRNSMESAGVPAVSATSNVLQHVLGTGEAVQSLPSESLRSQSTGSGTTTPGQGTVTESKAAAAVASNHRETLAGVERAEALLRVIQPEAIYDELNAHANNQAGSKHTSSRNSTVPDQRRAYISAIDREVDDTGEEGEDFNDEDDSQGEDDEEDAEISEVAILRKGTLVSPIRASRSHIQLTRGLTDSIAGEQLLRKAASAHRAEQVDFQSIIRAKDRAHGEDKDVRTAVDSNAPTKQISSSNSFPDIMQGADAFFIGKKAHDAAESARSAQPGAKGIVQVSNVAHDRQESVNTTTETYLRTSSKSTQGLAGDRGRQMLSDGRYAAVFGEVALAFKQLQAEKRTLEKFIRAITPLQGLSNNGEDFVRYLLAMNEKVELSATEIRKLLDLLERQRATMDHMLEIHQSEIDSHLDEIDDVRDELEDALQALEGQKIKVSQLARESDKLRSDALSIREEAATARASVASESQQRHKAIAALEAAKAELQAAEQHKQQRIAREEQLNSSLQKLRSEYERLKASYAQREEEVVRITEDIENLRATHEEHIATLGADHEREIWNLKEEQEDILAKHNSQIEQAAERLMHTHNEALDMPRSEHAETIEKLQARIAALESSHEASRQAKHVLIEAIDDKEEQLERRHHQLMLANKEGEELQARNAGFANASPSPGAERAASTDFLSARHSIARKNSFDELAVQSSAQLSLSTPILLSSAATVVSLSGEPTEQIKQLQNQLAEQRARESQIRSAYKLLRDEHRRLQNSHKEIVERSGRSASSGAASFALGTPSHRLGHGEDDHGQLVTTPGHSGTSGVGGLYFHQISASPTTPVHSGLSNSRTLKRLSLPLVSATGSPIASSKEGFPQHVFNTLASGGANGLKGFVQDFVGAPATRRDSHPPNSWRGSFPAVAPNSWQPSSPSARDSPAELNTRFAPSGVVGSLAPGIVGYVGRDYIASNSTDSNSNNILIPRTTTSVLRDQSEGKSDFADESASSGGDVSVSTSAQ